MAEQGFGNPQGLTRDQELLGAGSKKSISLSSSLGASIVCPVYPPSRLFVSKWKKKCQDSVSSLPSESWKEIPAIEWQMVFEWYTAPLPLGLLWRSPFGLLLVRVGGCCVMCDYSITILIIFACFQTIVAAFLKKIYTHWVVTQAFFFKAGENVVSFMWERIKNPSPVSLPVL